MSSHQQHKQTRHKQKLDKRPAGLPPTKQLHITVAVSPGMEANVAREVQMVKAALLYADSVSLCSPGISTVLATRDPSRLNARERTNLLLQMAPLLGFPSENMNTFEVMLKAIRNPAVRRSPLAGTLVEFQSKIDHTWQDIAEKSDQIIQQTGTYQLIPLMQSGLVKLHPLPVTLLDVLTTSVDRSLGRKNTEEAARRYFEVVSRAIQSINTHLLLDEDTSSLVQLAIRDGVLQLKDVQVTRHKHVGLSAQILQRLPTFDDATIDEVVHARKELEQPLVRFRGAMIEYATAMQSAQWDTEFHMEADLVFRQRVAPALLDLEGEMKANTFVRLLIAKATQSKVLLPSGGISASSLTVLLSHLSSLGDLAHLALAGGSLTAGIEMLRVVGDAKQNWTNQQRSLEQNHLYFAYRLNKLLAK